MKQALKKIVKVPLQQAAARFGAHRRNAAGPRLWILMYHRILPPTDPRYAEEEPGMIVEPDTFRMHLQTLKRHFTVMPLGEWVERARNDQPLPPKACAITFDDGWLDNYEYAFPILQQEQVPATLFAVSHMIGTRELFWPNRIVRLLQQPRERLREFPWLAELLGEEDMDAERSSQLIYSLKSLPDHELLERIDKAEAELGLTAPEHPVLLDWHQLAEMAESGLFEIGSHTCHHFRLRETLPAEVLEREVSESKQRLEERLERPVELFCYPNGDLCPQAREAVFRHYRAAVTTCGGICAKNTDAMQMPRYGVHQGSASTPTQLLARLSGWPMT